MRFFQKKSTSPYINFKFLILLIIILQQTSEDTRIESQPALELPEPIPKTPKKCNGNAPSSFYLDILLNSNDYVQNVGNFAPWGLATKKRIEDNPSQTSVLVIQALIWQQYKTSLFQPVRRLQEETDKYGILVKNLEQSAWEEFNQLYANSSSPEKEQVKQKLWAVLAYRFQIEVALYASQLEHINCGEQVALAFVEELIRAKNGYWPSNMPFNLYRISVGKGEQCNAHRFLVKGSTTLPDSQRIYEPTGIAQILSNMDGEIIDNWNNPLSGGIHLPASEARAKYMMYSSDVSKIWDCMEIIRFSAIDIHLQIQEIDIPQEMKEFLCKYAGPPIEEVAQHIHSYGANTPSYCI